MIPIRSRANYRGRRHLLFAAIVILSLSTVAVSKARPSTRALAPANAVLVQDKGKFKISVNGASLGTEEFEIHPSGDRWVAQGSADVHPPGGQPAHVSAHLMLQPDGTPVSYDWSAQGTKKASAEIQFQNSIATIILRLDNAKPFTQQFTFTSPLIAILDNNLYHQYSILARLYDREKKGRQTFSVLVPQEMTPGTVTVESIPPASGSNAAEMLRVQTADLEVDLSLDAKGRLVKLVAPGSNAEVVRE
ncbi:MAG TPA: hypothetical protein VIH76_02835 [Candidatus Acidoferrales bacterium]